MKNRLICEIATATAEFYVQDYCMGVSEPGREAAFETVRRSIASALLAYDGLLEAERSRIPQFSEN